MQRDGATEIWTLSRLHDEHGSGGRYPGFGLEKVYDFLDTSKQSGPLTFLKGFNAAQMQTVCTSPAVDCDPFCGSVDIVPEHSISDGRSVFSHPRTGANHDPALGFQRSRFGAESWAGRGRLSGGKHTRDRKCFAPGIVFDDGHSSEEVTPIPQLGAVI